MNENVNTAAVTQEPVELELDLKDMLATLFLRWKTLLLCLLAGALVFGLYTLRSAPRTTTVSFVTEEEVFAARQAVSEDRAEAVERLYDRVRFYRDYLENIEQEYSGFAGYGARGVPEDTVILQGTYYVASEIDNLESFFLTSPLSEEDYDALRALVPESTGKADIYERVKFTTSWGNSAGIDEGQYLFSVSVYGSTEDQCGEMLSVVERALLKKAAELRKVDPVLKLESVGSRITYDARTFLQSQQDTLWNRYSNADYRLSNQQSKVNALTGAEKAYYDKLVALDSGDTTVSTGGRSLKKWTAIGGMLGLFGGVVLVFWPYLFDGRVKTAGELEYSLRSMVLSRVCVKGKRNLFGRWAARLTGTDDVDPGVKADMVAADLGVLIEKNGKKTLYFLCDSGDANAASLAEQVKARLQEKTPSAIVSVGNPLSAAEELEKIGAAELGVVFAEVKKTKRSQLRHWLQICTRYHLPVAGSVAVQKCW